MRSINTTGINGLDEMLHGGVPDASITSIVGPTGSGKTIMSLQFLHANLLQGKKCLYISAAHTLEELVTNSLKFGWDFAPYIENQMLIVKTFEPVSIICLGTEVTLTSKYLDELPEYLHSHTADVVILDSITEFLMLCKNDIERRARILNMFQLIKGKGSNALITAESDTNTNKSTFGTIEFVADGIISLQRVQSKNLAELIHIIRIIKMRWMKHSREIRQYDITDTGIEVYSKYHVMLQM